MYIGVYIYIYIYIYIYTHNIGTGSREAGESSCETIMESCPVQISACTFMLKLLFVFMI